MFGRKKKKQAPIIEAVEQELTIPDPLPDTYDFYFKVYGTSDCQDVLSIIAEHTLDRTDPTLHYARFSDEKIKDIGKPVDQVYGLFSSVLVEPVGLGYDVTCKHGKIGFMPIYVMADYQALVNKYKKKSARIYLKGGKAKYYDKEKDEMCYDWSEYEAKCRITFKDLV